MTVLGQKQADALAKRLSIYGIDRIYSSPSGRAVQTAKSTCDLVKKEIQIVDFANEALAWNDFSIEKNGSRKWLFFDIETKILFADESVISLGHKWCEHKEFKDYKRGVDNLIRT